jgi:hypothetical protein
LASFLISALARAALSTTRGDARAAVADTAIRPRQVVRLRLINIDLVDYR